MAVADSVQIERLPATIEEYISVRDEVSRTPEGGAAMMVVALIVYANEEKLGRQCLTVAVDSGCLSDGALGYKGMQLRNNDLRRIQSQIKAQAYLPNSYIKGATPENGYNLPEPPHTFQCSDNPYSGDVTTGTFKVFLATSGAATPRPVTVKVNDKGIWKAAEWSSLIVGIKHPAVNAPDEL